jgi:hypothetical protein
MTGASDDEPPGTGDAVRSARGVEQQVLAEMAEEERDRTLDLSQALLERFWRGDAVTVRVLGRAFDGFVVHVGDDLVTLRTVDGATVDVRIGAVLSVASLESGTGVLRALGQPDPRRFVARLREILDAGDVPLVVGAEHGAREMRGRLVRIHADHVVFEADEGSEWLLPLATVAFVRREPPGPLA